ncbi:uncharacterized protein A1O5_12908 [Cladophialophora psammophila CBS 110553]|uniref:ABM domain-containing protein n=1 Tax=Cladophialophora psammophila CBS 110553 TaxID=1182543 RepID=W9VGV9_9EURO|nr:uncharacterized protein A1O5_12908 [Cladophialophora psammophila CBS 110553]EXJ54842.1 hypothetical protein A1O5_12908 [Cladophialophora psammophila CBS 110553]
MSFTEVLCEVLLLQAKEGQKDLTATSMTKFCDFASHFPKTETSEGSALAQKIFPIVREDSQEVYVFVVWRSRGHHDGLVTAPGFEPSMQMLINEVFPTLAQPAAAFYVKCDRVGPDFLTAGRLHLIEVQLNGHDSPEEVGNPLERVLSAYRDKLGCHPVLFGLQDDDSRHAVVVLKWSANCEEVGLDKDLYDRMLSEMKAQGEILRDVHISEH